MHNTAPSKYRGWLTSGIFSLTAFLLTASMTMSAFAQQPGNLDPTFSGYKDDGKSVLAPASAAQPIASVLNEDGSIKQGVSGSFDPKGFRMATGRNGKPRFVADSDSSTSALATTTDCNDGWDDRFFTNGVKGFVGAIASDGTGVIYVGGGFDMAGSQVANNIAKWDGTSWSSLGSGMNGRVFELAVSGTGDVYAGGDFTTAGGISANSIAKWNGSSWSALGSGASGPVSALAVSGTGDVYAGGNFTTADGTPANSIAKWNGSSWSALGTGPSGPVSALAVSGNDVYAGGSRYDSNGNTGYGFVDKWDGSSWVGFTFDLPTFVDEEGNPYSYGGVYALAVSGSDVYAGGVFLDPASVAGPQNIAKWNGTNWSAFGFENYYPVSDIIVSGNGDVYTINGGVSKWDGSSWSPLGIGGVYALAITGNDEVYAGGSFTQPGGVVPANNIAKWNGTVWTGVGPTGNGVYGDVYVVTVSGNDVYVGGRFLDVGGVPANNIAKWNGTNWSALGSGIGSGGEVHAITISPFSGSVVYVGGRFWQAGGHNSYSIAVWDGRITSWISYGTINFASGSIINAIAISGNNAVYVGGSFITAHGVTVNNIAKLNSAGWSALGSGIEGTVNAIVLAGNGDVYAGGGFTNAGGVTVNNIAKWNGTSWSALGSGMNGGVVTALTVSGGDLYAGGGFTAAGGVPANGIAKWNGTNWSALGSGMGGGTYHYVSDLAVSGTGDVYAGGYFTTAGGVPANSIAKWNGTSWSVLGSGVGGFVNALAVSGSNLYVVGGFSTAGCHAASNFSRYDLTTTPTPTPTPTPMPTPTPGPPVTITVTNTNDSGAGSLRQAMADATPGSTINFDPSVFATSQTITLTSGQLVIDKNLTIQGPGASLLSISGNNASRVFHINSGITTLDGMTIRDGKTTDGGGILNQGTLTVNNSTISGNWATFDGGGIFSGGPLIVINSSVSNNSAGPEGGYGGGGIFTHGGTLTIIDSTISGNYADSSFDGETVYGGFGGGIHHGFNGAGGTLTVSNSNISGNGAHFSGGGILVDSGAVTVNNSTISGNDARSGEGGGIFNFGNGTLTLNSSTISGNTSDRAGTGIYNGGTLTVTNSTVSGNHCSPHANLCSGDGISANSTETLNNTIIAGNYGGFGPADISGTIDTASHNLIGDVASSGGITNGVNGNIVGVNPMLRPLQNNGGPTFTHALLPGSPAINAGNNCVLTTNGCGDGNPALPTDQRGFPRVGTVDIGAFERQDSDPTPPDPTERTNFALASNGGVASASSVESSGGYPAASAVNGDRNGLNWNNGGGWNDATWGVVPDWLQVDFSGPKTIDEISVFTVQDNFTSPVEPTESDTFGSYGITDFDIQYWNGSSWVTVTNGSVTNNDKVWKKVIFSPVETTQIRVLVNASLASYSRITEIEAWGGGSSPTPTPGVRTNFALASNGGVASASSVESSGGYPAASAVNGDRNGLNWNNGGGWNDATWGVVPDWLQVDFSGPKTIDEISVFTVQDNFTSPVEPTEAMTFSTYGITDFDVQYWNGFAWVTVPNGQITGNDKVWKKITFSPVETIKIRVLVNNALSFYSRITEIEAWGEGV